uniref:hypothetical protein n=1 Tax=Clostridium sp. NkU-1 TaxID=1095009 RepID=UPI00326106D0
MLRDEECKWKYAGSDGTGGNPKKYLRILVNFKSSCAVAKKRSGREQAGSGMGYIPFKGGT